MSSYYRTLIGLFNLNLLTQSEGNISTYSTKVNVSDALTSIVGFDNSVYFNDAIVNKVAYKSYLPIIGVTYNLSCFIQMDDGGTPVPGLNLASNDFSFVLNGRLAVDNKVVNLFSGSIYRVSYSIVAVDTTSTFGVLKYSTQSTRKFKISGIQLTQGADLKPYQKTT